jgi:hypothetical protein
MEFFHDATERMKQPLSYLLVSLRKQEKLPRFLFSLSQKKSIVSQVLMGFFVQS